MTNRWTILVVLFIARTTMAFQFQTVAALSPFLMDSLALTLIDIGLLIGLYLGPGVVVALPGGAIAARLGDKRVVGSALFAMLLGGVLMALSTTWEPLVAGRILSGVGGVVINVVMTKMLIDWFADREIATAMGVLVSSWPVGIALALITLPFLAEIGGLATAWMGMHLLIIVSLVLFILLYRAADTTPNRPATDSAPAPFPTAPLITAALIWALYNAALAMVFGFGPLLLNEQGMDSVSASAIISMFMFFLAIGVPVGGILSDKTGQRDSVILASTLGCAVLLPLMVALPLGVAAYVFGFVGFVFGLAAGPIMTMPTQVLPPHFRAFGMGAFFTVYYAFMMVAPVVAGGLAERANKTDVAFLLGSIMLLICAIALAIFRKLTRQRSVRT